ncbi:MAG TPA: hypothetical protein VMN57_16875 [Anaerolineales bacterium]|nr:hypothetical protein [Anaerolineales bacterium]
MLKKLKGTGLVIVLALAALACNLGKTPDPATPVAVVTEIVGDLVEAWQEAFEEADETGILTVTLTEAQLSTFLAVAAAQNPALLLANPQVTLRDGEMEVSGKYSTGPVNAEARLLMAVSVGAEGLPVIEVTSAKLGPLPVPAEMLATVSDTITEALAGQFVSAATGFTLKTIVITEGAITMTGTRK